jgi:ribosomal protein S18 acetylase RimI-like enzyme
MADFDRPWDASDPSANAAVAVRAATVEDTAAIHGLHVSCFPDLFAGLLGDYLPPVKERVKRERSWTGPIGCPLERHALLVAERSQRVIGFVAVGPTRDADGRATGELRTIIVDRGARGSSVGSALLAAGERAMRACEFLIATLWAVPENRPAVGLYERCGWRRDGTERVQVVGGREITSVRFGKRLMC